MKKTQKNNSLVFKKVTIIFGYSIFALILVGAIVSTIVPLGGLLFNPVVKHFNVAMMLISFASAAILPSLLSYILGDRATHSKNKLTHHYNGVLFGIAAYWLASFITGYFWIFFGPLSGMFPGFEVIVVNILPIVALLIVMTFVAVSYARNQKNKDSVMEHRPYQVVLIGVFIASLIAIIAGQFFDPSTIGLIATLFVIVPVGMVAISYKAVAHTQATRSARLTAAVVAVTIGFIAATVTGQIISYLTYNTFAAILIGAGTWIAYLFLVSRRRK